MSTPFIQDDQIELDAIKRRQAMADSLRQQAMSSPQGQMVSGRYVPAAFTQQIQPLLAALASHYTQNKTDADTQALTGRINTRNQNDLSGFVDALRGKAAQPGFQTGANEMGDEPVMQNEVPAVAPDRNKALGIALGSRNPMLQTAGGAMMKDMLASPKWEKAELPNADGSKRVGFVNVNSPDPISTFQAGGTAPVKLEGVNTGGNTTFVNPYAPNSNGAPTVNATGNPYKDNLVAGPNGPVPNAPMVQVKKDIAAAGKPVTNVSVNTATKPFLQEIGKGVGEQVVNDFGGARAAVQTMNNVQQIRQGLGNAILGPGANTRIKLDQIGQVLGVNGKDTTERLQNTRQVVQGLARQELAAAGSMKGQGQITESERGILRRAESGQIDELTAPEVNTLLGALEKTARYRINLHSQNMERLKKDPNAAGVADYMHVEAPQGSGGSSLLEQADAILRGGK